MALTSDALIAAAKLRAFWPATNAPLTDAQILTLANEEIQGTLYPMVIGAHADYYQTVQDYDIVSGQSQYRLPARAYGPLKDVTIVNEDETEFSVGLIDAEELGQGVGAQGYYAINPAGGLSFAMYFAGDWMHLRPIPNATLNTLRVRYYRAPSTLCLLAEATTVAALGNGLTTFTLDSTPAGFSGARLDLIVGGNAHQTFVDDQAVTTITTDVVTLTESGNIEFLAVGDYVSVAGTSPLVQLPDFMLPGAIAQIAAACLDAHGDAMAAGLYAKANKLIELAFETAIPRVEGEPKFILTSNSPWRCGP